ncbi:iron uptake transporter permease EfeU [Microvirgula aerodenitrificans]|uniref:iron uptake transporter permease EfeU n=1 Tax=Microvirgula aerodenitrificans TaxID=57480 RepID=UPI0005635628|nr:iron uptake transporter permease EfeU [Microvirgula aerodenitrificans]
MLVPFLIMLREGMEAALIVGIIASYLRQSGQRKQMPAVWAGVVLACVLSLALGFLIEATQSEFPQKQQELFEAVVALVAVGILTSMVFWMKQAARSIKAHLHDSIDAALNKGNGQAYALVGMVFFAVAREGLESVFFLLAAFQQQEVGLAAPLGAMLGLAVAVALGIGIYQGGIRLDLRRFFRWTGVFILFVAAGLLAGAVKALHEAGVWNQLQTVVFDLSLALPADSPFGVILAGLFGYNDTPTVGEALAWLLFLLPSLYLFLAGRGQPALAPRTH